MKTLGVYLMSTDYGGKDLEIEVSNSASLSNNKFHIKGTSDHRIY